MFLKAVSLSYYCTEGSCSGIREAIRPYDKTEETCPRLGVRGAHLEDVRGVLDRDGLLDDARIGRSLARAELVDLGDGVAAAGFVRAGHARREGVPEVEPARAVAVLCAARRGLDLACTGAP